MGITLLLGPFWTKRPLKYHTRANLEKNGFLPEKRLCALLALIVWNLRAKYRKKSLEQFLRKIGDQPTTTIMGVILWDLRASAGPITDWFVETQV
jgi:hypothetical protein